MHRIVTTLTSVEALDLSDVPHLPKRDLEDYNEKYPHVSKILADDPWPPYISGSSNQQITKLLQKLTWLGLPDFNHFDSAAPLILVERLLARCTSLQTLSIRGGYYLQPPETSLSHKSYTDYFSDTFIGKIPGSVGTLEIRFKPVYLSAIIKRLHEGNNKRILKISRVGIDLGAWIQTLPFQDHSETLQDKDVISTARLAAQKIRFDTYEPEHNKIISLSSEWRLPELRAHQAYTTASGAPPSNEDDARPLFKHNFYSERKWINLRQSRDEIVSGILRRIHSDGIKAASCGIILYAL